MTTNCIITGVVLFEDDLAYRGDLFEQHGTYIVNCNEQGSYGFGKEPSLKWIEPTGDYWTRKGVYVIPMSECQLSVAALEYIGK